MKSAYLRRCWSWLEDAPGRATPILTPLFGVRQLAAALRVVTIKTGKWKPKVYRSTFSLVVAARRSLVALAQPLDPTYWRADKSKYLTQLILQKALVSKMQRLPLVRK